MLEIKFPIRFTFKVTTFSNDFTATDSDGRTIAFVKQKLFKLKEDIRIYSDDTQQDQIYTIKADRWLDFSAAYAFFDQTGKEFGKVVRKGWKSLWRAEYQLIDQDERPQYSISEESVWVRFMDGLLGAIPIVNILTGYFFNPSYLVKNKDDAEIVRISKMPSFFGRRFELTQVGKMDSDDDDRIMLGLMMMILLERRRG